MRIISGEFGGRRLKTASGPGYRPATDKVRQAVFSILEARGLSWNELRAADLFAGSGSLGMECLSRGAAQVWFVEKNRKALSTIQSNLNQLGIPPSRYSLLGKDVLFWLRKASSREFDLIFIDPPYGHGLLSSVLEAVLQRGWLGPHALIMAEVESDLDPQQQVHDDAELLLSRTYGQTRICLWTAKDRK
ncbi:MAG: 16S rRNA (guanine(966)-N(2))-methyltransferase RsmD [Desulfohalobiaceae bacterium]